MRFDKNVFINCPFDEEYLPLLRELGIIRLGALLLIFACALLPLCAQSVKPNSDAPIAGVKGKAIDADSGASLAGIRIELRRLPGPSTYMATTDASGDFSVTSVEEGHYVLSAETVGYAFPDRAERSVDVTRNRIAVAPLVKLRKAGFIEGVVEDENRKPVEDVAVELVQTQRLAGQLSARAVYGQFSANPASSAEVLTSKEGRFVFSPVPPGTYYIRAMGRVALPDETKEPPRIATVYYPNSGDLLSAAPVTVLSGVGESGLILKLRPPSFFNVSGKVTGMSAGISKPRVLINEVPSPDSSIKYWRSNPHANTDIFLAADGTFQLDHMQPGYYVLTLLDQSGLLQGGTPLTVSDRDVQDVRISAAAVGRFSGRVVLPGGKYDAGEMRFYLRSFDELGEQLVTFRISKDGTFAADGVRAGTYTLTQAAIPRKYLVKSLELGYQHVDGPTFEFVPPGADGVTIRLDTEGLAIAGAVDGPKEVLGEVLLTAARVPTGYIEALSIRFAEPEGTNFVIRDLEPGQYRICAWLDRDRRKLTEILSEPRFQQRLSSDCVAKDLKDGDQHQIVVKPVSSASYK